MIEQLITKGVDEDSRKIGAYYVLGALTIVNVDAAASLLGYMKHLIYK